MILEALRSANSVILDSVNAANNKQAAQNFKKQVETLSAYTSQLEHLLNLLMVLKKKNLAAGVISADIRNALQDAVDRCGEKTYDHTLDIGTVTALKNAVELCRNSIHSAWKDIADKECGAVIEDLTSLRGLLDNKKEADEILEYLNNAKVNMPVSEKVLETFIIRVDKGKKIVDDLHFESDPEVKPFIDKVRLQKATVGDLSPHILDWLKDNHLTDKIKLRFQT